MEQAQALEHYVVGGGFQSSGIRLNNAIAPTNDIRVRQAINHAIDRESIAQTIFRGAAKPIAFFGFQPVNLEPFPYNPTRATELIQDAGIQGEELELVYGEGRIPEETQLAEIYKASFEAIGLKIKLTRLEPAQYNELGGKPFPEQPPLYMETTSSGNFGEIAGGLRDKYGCEGTGTFCKPEYDQEF
jgi:ABC-type transport system substrate-binding protein